MWEWLLEVARHVALAQPAAAAPAQPPCSSRFAYTEWEKTGEDRWFEGEWVMQQVHYQRVRTDTCDGSQTTEYKSDGPIRLWPAVPGQRIADVNHPNGPGEALDGDPLSLSAVTSGMAGGQGADGSAEHVARVPGTSNDSGRQKPPYLPSLALLAGVLVATVRNQWVARGYDARVRNTGAFLWGAAKGIGVALLTIAAVAGVVTLFGISTPVLLALAAVAVVGGGIAAYFHRRKQQEANGIRPNLVKTAGVAALDALGLSGVIEGIAGQRMLTGEQLDQEAAGESFGAGLVQVAALGVGARTFPKGLGRVSAAASESILSRIGRTLSAWSQVRKAPEASLPRVWRILGVIDEGAGYREVMSKLPAPLRTLTNRLIEAEWLVLRENGLLQGPAGKVALSKAKEALITNNVRRLWNIFNNVKGGEAQLRARQIIESEAGFDSFVADIRDPSAPGLDLVVKMKDGTYQIGEIKRQGSAVGPNKIHRVLRYAPGKNGKPGKARIDLELLETEIIERIPDPREHLPILEALYRGDASVVLRIELVDTKATGSLSSLHDQVVNGVKILINPPPKGR